MKRDYGRLLTIVLRVGIVLYPSYFVLDWFVYPDQKYTMLAIRVAVAAYLFVVQAVYPKIRDKLRFPVLLSSFFVVAFALSLMCLVSGQGFASPYTVGILQIVMVSTLFTDMRRREYALSVALIVAQHFILLMFGPWSLPWFLINVFGIGVFAALAVIAQAFIRGLVRENTDLKGILPICASCKKVRDDEGYWKEVTAYVSARSEVLFSHGLCPDCMRKLYPEFAEAPAKPERPGPDSDAGG